MERSKLSWEEVIKYEKVKKYEDIYFNKGRYYLIDEIGTICTDLIVYEIPKDLYELLKSGEKTEYDISYYLREDRWPPTEEVLKKAEKEFIIENPISLIYNPEDYEMFTEEELEKLIPIAEKDYIEDEGNLPKDYVSPIRPKRK